MKCIICDFKWGDNINPTVCPSCAAEIGGLFAGSLDIVLRRRRENKTSSEIEKPRGVELPKQLELGS